MGCGLWEIVGDMVVPGLGVQCEGYGDGAEGHGGGCRCGDL